MARTVEDVVKMDEDFFEDDKDILMKKEKLENISESNCQSDETRKDENYRNQEKEISDNENKDGILGAIPDPESTPAKQGKGDFDNENKNETRPKQTKEEKAKMSKEEEVYRREGERAEAVMFITRNDQLLLERLVSTSK